MHIPRQTCTYVEASAVFKGLQRAWNLFAESDPDCTWGNNNRTLVTPDTITIALEGVSPESEEEEAEVNEAMERLRSLGETYVDLEN